MSCFFCKSKYHISVNCDVHVSDAARKRITRSRLYCSHCLTPYGFKHLFTKNCESKTKCYICFSKKHHTFFCPERHTIPFFYFPSIDADLMERFLHLLYPFEQYLLACATPESIMKILTKPLVIVNECSPFMIEEEADSVIIVVNNIIRYKNYCYDYEKNRKFLELLQHKVLIVKARIVELKDTTLERDELFLFLTFNVRKLEFSNLTVLPHVTFAEILERTSNIVEIEIDEKTNVELDKFWPNNLLDHLSNDGNFVKLQISIKDINFDIKKLVEFMKNKCVKNADIMLKIYFSNKYPNFDAFKKTILEDIGKFFIPIGSNFKDVSTLHIYIHGNQYTVYHEKFILPK